LIIATELSLSSACVKARVKTNNDERDWRVDLFAHPAAKKVMCVFFCLFLSMYLQPFCSYSSSSSSSFLIKKKSNSLDELKQLHQFFSSHSLSYFSFSFAHHHSRKKIRNHRCFLSEKMRFYPLNPMD